jgi:predicted DNA-binding transcriptional regulator YafY
LKLLKQKPFLIKELSKEIKVSDKTTYRYIRDLKENGFVFQKTFGKYFIVSVKKSEERAFCEKFSQEFDKKILNKLRESSVSCHKARFNYLSPRYHNLFQVDVFCVDVIEIRKRFYLVGYDKAERIFKEYRIDRISDLRIFPEINKSIKDKLYQISFLLLPELSKHYEGQFDDYNILDLPDGTKKVTMRIHSFFRAKKILFSYLDQIQILEPLDFAEDCLKTLKEMTKNFCLKI